MSERDPISMEQHFNPGFKIRPAIHVGSQTMRFFEDNPKEQAYEGRHLAAAGGSDIVVVRGIDNAYLRYWNSLTGMNEGQILNLFDAKTNKFLTRLILENPQAQDWIKDHAAPRSQLMVFLPTQLEQELADKLTVPLHGSPTISDSYGTKSGIRKLAKESNIPMSPGFICSTYDQVQKAIKFLGQRFDSVAIKHDLSTGGGWSKRVSTANMGSLTEDLNEISGGKFMENRDILVVEGWLKSKVSLSAHVEILDGQEPIVCAGWQQIIDKDGITYMGAGPLMTSEKATESFSVAVGKIALNLKGKGAVGSYCPDFLIVADDETNFEPDSAILLELNARVPATAFPLEIVKQVKGEIGNGFCAQRVKLSTIVSFSDIAATLRDNNLLITKKDSRAHGVVPYNVGLLPWKFFDVAAMANTWDETCQIMQKVNSIFH